MNVFREMALDAGYRGEEANMVAEMLEQEEREREAERLAELDAYRLREDTDARGVDQGGGLVVSDPQDPDTACRNHEEGERDD